MGPDSDRVGPDSGGALLLSRGRVGPDSDRVGPAVARHQLQPNLLSHGHSLIYIHCITPSSFGSSWLFIQQILIH